MKDYNYYIGIDLDDRNAVLSYYKSGMKEPETLSILAGSEVFQIPVLVYKRKGIGQWFVGADAKKQAEKEGQTPIGNLLSRAFAEEMLLLEEEKYSAKELLVLYLKKLLFLAGGLENTRKPDFLVFTAEKISGTMAGLFTSVGEKLGIAKENIRVIDRKESFYYFVLNQKEELWLHDVFLFDYRDDKMKCCMLQRNLRTTPQVVTLDETEYFVKQEQKDEEFLQILKECFQGRIVSCVYLAGNGFEGEWMRMSLAFMCKGRRAFIGKNLYSKGACYAAFVSRKQVSWPYVYFGDNEMKFNISLKVKNRGNMEFFSLISAGDNCYETVGTCDVILDGTPEIDFWLQLPSCREAKIEKLTLADLPERENKTTRLRIVATPLSDTEVKIQIQDMGFGEIVKSSGKSWEYTMAL